MDKLEQAKINFDLLGEFPRAKKIGTGTYRVNPCPVCGGDDHFTVFEPNSPRNKNLWWTYSSFSGCCKGGSPYDYLMEFKGLTKESAARELLGDESTTKTPVKKQNTKTIPQDPKQEEVKNYDFSLLAGKLHEECVNSKGIEYYKGRGLNKTIYDYKLGYSESGYNSALKDYKEQQTTYAKQSAFKYVIPIQGMNGGIVNFIFRHDNSIVEKHKTRNLKNIDGNIPVALLNERYLNQSIKEPIIFICEGWADALSIEELGRRAIALNSTSMVKRFLELVESNISKVKNKTFVIALDNDGAGKDGTPKLIEGLNGLKLAYEVLALPKGYKDVNEYLVADRSGLEGLISDIEDKFIENTLEFSNGAKLFEGILGDVETNFNNGGLNLISTGFPQLDRKIGGGLYSGLYVIGAGSSIGKTTFVQQIGDNIAADGKKVLYFSLEMGKKELLAKTIVREIYRNDSNMSIGSREFLNGKFNQNIWDMVAMNSPKIIDVVQNTYYLEGTFGTTINDIVSKTRMFKNIHGEAPVVIVDYLQAIAPADVRMGDKQSVDLNIAELKRLSRDLDTPVIAISSVNRQNYLSYIDFSAFKESGSIEYGADVLIGLQLNVIYEIMKMKDSQLNEKRELYNQAKSATPREVELVVLKNRFGAATGKHNYEYSPKYNLFEELDWEEIKSGTKGEALPEVVASLFE